MQGELTAMEGICSLTRERISVPQNGQMYICHLRKTDTVKPAQAVQQVPGQTQLHRETVSQTQETMKT